MRPILFESNATDFSSNGLGSLNPTSCVVKEKVNGEYTLEAEIPLNSPHTSELEVRRIIYATVNETDWQPFRIENVVQEMNDTITVYANHISYDLNGIPVRPFNARGIRNTMNGLISNSMITNPFTMWSDISNTSSQYVQSLPSSFRAQLGGVKGSLLDVFGGVYEWDMFTVKLHAHRGVTTPRVTIQYGKNLTSFKQEMNIASTYTGVLGYWTKDEEMVQSRIQYIPNHLSYPQERIAVIDFSSDFDEKPTVAQLNARSIQYIEANNIGVPKVNIDLSFIDLSTVENFKDKQLPSQKVRLDDVVAIYFESLGVESTSAKVIETEWNCLKDRYENIVVGDVKATLSSTLNSLREETQSLVTVSSRQEEQRNQLASLVANGLGLFSTAMVLENGSTKYYWHNRPTMEASSTLWAFVDNVFSVSTDGGNTWNAGITADGKAVLNMLDVIGINADWINAGLISADRIGANSISVGKLTGSISNGNWKIDLDNGTLTIGNISADNINAGYLSADRIASNSIAVGKLTGSISNNNWVIDLTNGTLTIGNISADNINAGSLSADRISGGTLTLGGRGDVNGKLQVLNEYGDIILTIDEVGARGLIYPKVTNGNFIASNGTINTSYSRLRVSGRTVTMSLFMTSITGLTLRSFNTVASISPAQDFAPYQNIIISGTLRSGNNTEAIYGRIDTSGNIDIVPFTYTSGYLIINASWTVGAPN